ncbi:MAG: secretin and TonB N-terminal domain-containing protein [bacterium]
MNLKRYLSFILIILWCLGCTGIRKKVERVLPGAKTEALSEDSSHAMEKPVYSEKAPTPLWEEGLIEPPFKGPQSQEKSLSAGEDPNNAQEKRYFLSMIDSDLRAVLLSFSKGSPYSIILDPNVNGRVTMDLNEVTLEEALDTILIPLGYEYTKKGNLIRVSRPKLDTRIFTLNYLATVREGRTIIEAKTPGGVSGASAEPTKVTNQDKSDLWDEIEKGLQHLLSEEGKFFINKMASIVIVTDYSKNLKEVADFLETVEGTIQRQVVIEATIVEVMLSNDHQMGLDWTYLVGSETGSSFLGDNTKFALNTSGLMSTSVFEFSFQYKDVDALLNAISEQGQMNIISRPRITTLNNQKALIKVGTEEVYFERETETSTTTSTETYTAKFFTVGLLLDVTPQISAEDEITLHIHPVISEKVEERPYPIGGGTIPIVSVRESSSVVQVKSGNTVVLTGLMMEKDNRNASGIPWLMEIPFLGKLFRYDNTEKTKTELVITLTPRILCGKEMHEYSDEMLENILRFKDEKARRKPRHEASLSDLSNQSVPPRRRVIPH